MRIDPKDTIAGMPAKQVRDLLYRMMDDICNLRFVADWLDVPLKEARPIVDRLRDLSYLELRSHGKHEYWGVTPNGRRLALASAAKPISRNTADKAVRELLERVKKVNEDPYYLYRVTKVIVFGSYLTDCPTLNDVDIAIGYAKKPCMETAFVELATARAKEAQSKGRHFSTYLDMITWAETEVWQFVKSRSRTLSFHSMDDGVLEVVEQRVLFELPDTEEK